jgi:excisionase family DNA binding protein
MIIDDPDTGQRHVAMTTAEAAQFLGISVSSLRSRAQVGDIPVHRNMGAPRYFFFQHELEEWLRRAPQQKPPT